MKASNSVLCSVSELCKFRERQVPLRNAGYQWHRRKQQSPSFCAFGLCEQLLQNSPKQKPGYRLREPLKHHSEVQSEEPDGVVDMYALQHVAHALKKLLNDRPFGWGCSTVNQVETANVLHRAQSLVDARRQRLVCEPGLFLNIRGSSGGLCV
jgi:hypothetical protein